MTPQEKLQERLQLMDDTLNFRPTSRTLSYGSIGPWRVLDSDLNVTLYEACTDWDLMMKIIREVYSRYEFDGFIGSVTRNNFYYHNIFGSSVQEIDQSIVQSLDRVCLESNEYDDYLKDIPMFRWTRIMPRLAPNATYGQIAEAVKAAMKTSEFIREFEHFQQFELGVPLNAASRSLSGAAQLMYFYRGIKGLSMDMRRCPEKVEAFCEDYEKEVLTKLDAAIHSKDTHAYFSLDCSLVAQTIMNKKQFERFYWPTLKKCIDMCVANNKPMHIYIEGEVLRLKEYFQDIPKGLLMIHPESESVFEVRRQLPNAAVCGGMSTELLGLGTPQQCVDYAKRLIEEMGNGFVLGHTKSLAYPNDAKRENLMAVQDLIYSYRRQ